MKWPLRLAVVLAAGMAGMPAHAAESDAVKNVRQRHIAMEKAFNAHNADGVLEIFDPEYVSTEKNGRTRNHDEVQAALDRMFQAPNGSDFHVRYTIQKVQELEGGVAVTADVKFHRVNTSGKVVDETYRTREFWKQRDGAWRLLREREL